MKKITFILLILLGMGNMKTKGQVFNFAPPFESTPGCFDGSAYTLSSTLQIIGIQITSVNPGTFNYELLVQYTNTITGTIGNNASTFNAYQVTFTSTNPNSGSPLTNDFPGVPLAPGTNSNSAPSQTATYNGDATTLGFNANTLYTSLDTINFFAYTHADLSVNATCLVATNGADVVPLPIRLTDFYVKQAGKAMKLSWITAQEIDNSGYKLERSENGSNWQQIAWVSSQTENGNSNHPLYYVYTDNAPLAGLNYYRLMQLDHDGKYSYSKVVPAYNKAGNADQKLKVYPNPATESISIRFNPDYADKTIVLMDFTGRTIIEKSAPTSETSINIAGLPAGNYMLHAGGEKMKVTVAH